MILVTTKLSEKSLKTVAKNCYKNSAINTQVKDHIPLKKQQKIRNTGSIKISKRKKNECQKYKFITSWVAEYEMQLDPCDYPLY